ncbi:hypothetical protein B0O99DRAFT_684289 [Bisporella sp. PMI_857]|nr:hypothetical protein B0O99DRAFT_684289 [Bisporella sp. PMI_857]
MASGSTPLTEFQSGNREAQQATTPGQSSGLSPASRANYEGQEGTNDSGNRQPHEIYAHRIFSFSSRTPSERLYSGTHYRALSEFLIPNLGQSPHQGGTLTRANDLPSFVTIHTLNNGSNGSKRRDIYQCRSFDILSEKLDRLHGNRVVFLRGYPSSEWLCRLGAKLNLDYEFLYQHFANSSQLSVAESHSLPPLSLISTDTIQLTFTSIGSWDNHNSGINITTARREFRREMKEFVENLNSGQVTALCDSIVRSFYLHDLNYFSIEQMMSLKLLEHETFWTLLIWSDFGESLSRSHGGPWRQIEQVHSSATQFIPIPMQHSNLNIKYLTTSANRGRRLAERASPVSPVGLAQTLSFLHSDLGKSLDQEAANEDPFYAIDEIFRLHASSEHQFLNLMEEKAQEKGQSAGDIRNSIAEIKIIKKLVDKHRERLCDTLEIIEARGGRNWPQVSSLDQGRAKKAERAVECLTLTFAKLIRRAKAVSEACTDEMAVLSNDSMVREAQKSIQQAEGVAKVAFIAFVFVPLSFATSFFGMSIAELSGNGLGIWSWFALSIPLLFFSLLAWWMTGDKRRKLYSWASDIFQVSKVSSG